MQIRLCRIDWHAKSVESFVLIFIFLHQDLSEPVVVLYAKPEGEKENEEEQTFEVTEAVPDVELFGFGINTRSIQVLSGAYVPYNNIHEWSRERGLEKQKNV